MKDTLKEKILELAKPLVAAQGLEIWGLDLKEAPVNLVRLYVDLPLEKLQHLADAPVNGLPVESLTSASISQCEEISRALGLALEVEDCFKGPWTLEVSTPGLERKFFSSAQLAPYIGDMLEARLDQAPAGCADAVPRKVFRGRLKAADASGFTLELCNLGADGQILPDPRGECRIEWQNVQHARRIHIFDQHAKPGKKSRAK